MKRIQSGQGGLHRRDFLRGIGAGAALLGPFAQSRLSFAAPKAGANLLIFFTPNGFARGAFGADGAGTNFTLKPSLKALEPFKNDLVVVKGLCNKGQSKSSTHSDAMKLLICRYGDGERYRGNGPSFDAVMAKAAGQSPLFLGVNPIGSNAGYMAGLSWSAAGAQNSYVRDPKQAFASVFGGALGSSTGTPVDTSKLERMLAQDRSVLDFMRADLGAFKAQLSAADRSKLDLHLESLRDLEQRLKAPVVSAPTGMTCNSAALKTAVESAAGTDLRKNGELMVDLVTQGFACAARRVAVLVWQSASSGVNPVGGGGNHHDVTHSGDKALQARIDTWYAERFAYTLQNLKTAGQLDNTVVVWCSEISEEHNQNNFVNVVAGGKNLGLKLGQYINMPFQGDEEGDAPVAHNPGNASFADLLVSVQKAFGVNENTFGDPQHCKGGLPGLHVG